MILASAGCSSPNEEMTLAPPVVATPDAALEVPAGFNPAVEAIWAADAPAIAAAAPEEARWEPNEPQSEAWVEPETDAEAFIEPTAEPEKFEEVVAEAESRQIITNPDEVLDLDLTDEIVLSGEWVFNTGSAEISAKGHRGLQLTVPEIEALPPGTDVYVHGHVDEVGTPAFNLTLAGMRADSVVAVLRTSIPTTSHRIIPVPHGEDDLFDPTCHGDCPSNRVVRLSLDP